MTVGKAGKLALLWRGNRQARGEATSKRWLTFANEESGASGSPKAMR
jgi:hypothetical protein